MHQGGQAIVGAVQVGAGAVRNSKDQPHAKTIAHAPEQEMQSLCEADGEALSERSHEER